MTEAALEALHQTLWRLEQRWTPATPDADVFHAYEALPPALFLPPLLLLGDPDGRTFLDVGCGIGRNLAMASVLGWKVVGIDRHFPYLEAAKELVPEAELIHSDAFDIETFPADVVYIYRPMVAAEDEMALEQHVISGMRKGTILFLGSTSPQMLLSQVGPCLWRV